MKRLIGPPGFEPGDIRLSEFYWVLTGLFSMHLVRLVPLCFSVFRREVITRFSQGRAPLGSFTHARNAATVDSA